MDRSQLNANAGWASIAAATLCVAFAVLHLFWAVGGSLGLASSVGRDLAYRRPTSFVLFGLYGVAALLLVGCAVVLITAAAKASTRRKFALIVVFGVGIALLLRGAGLEMLLATNSDVRQQIGPLETRWSQLLWNPWFALGGSLFIATAVHAHRHPATGRSQ